MYLKKVELKNFRLWNEALIDLEKQLDKYDVQQMLSGEYDEADGGLDDIYRRT